MQPIAVVHEHFIADGLKVVGFDPFVRLVDDLAARAEPGT